MGHGLFAMGKFSRTHGFYSGSHVFRGVSDVALLDLEAVPHLFCLGLVRRASASLVQLLFLLCAIHTLCFSAFHSFGSPIVQTATTVDFLVLLRVFGLPSGSFHDSLRRPLVGGVIMHFLDKIRLGQIGLFIVVGFASTLIDFAAYNLLTGRPFRWPRIRANLVSTTVAMTFSFTINLLFVFPPDKFSVFERAVKFALVTACALYGIQSIVIHLTTNIWRWPVWFAVTNARKVPLIRNWSEDMIGRNVVKILATGFSLVWNFLWYKFYVFR